MVTHHVVGVQDLLNEAVDTLVAHGGRVPLDVMIETTVARNLHPNLLLEGRRRTKRKRRKKRNVVIMKVLIINGLKQKRQQF